MKKLILIFQILFAGHAVFAQDSTNFCSSNIRKTAKARVDSQLLKQKLSTLNVYELPLMIKLSVVIFAADDGTNAACEQSDVRRQISLMSSFFAPHNICFNLGDIRQVNNTELLSIEVNDEESDLEPYLRSGYLTIFVHTNILEDGKTKGGYAYGIPNDYFSVDGGIVADTSNFHIMAHEMGHCLGLYHTFEDGFGEENVARSGSCKDCEDDGDYLCDTQADREASNSFLDPNTCTYTGSRRDDCGRTLIMEPTNIMSYHLWGCTNRFTAGQGNRARNHIISESELTDALAGEDFNIYLSFTYTNDYKIYLAKNRVTFDANNYNTTGTAKVIASAKSIVVKPGTNFKPGSAGYAILRVNPYCQ